MILLQAFSVTTSALKVATDVTTFPGHPELKVTHTLAKSQCVSSSHQDKHLHLQYSTCLSECLKKKQKKMEIKHTTILLRPDSVKYVVNKCYFHTMKKTHSILLSL